MFENFLLKSEFRPGYFIAPIITAAFATGLSFILFYRNNYLGVIGSAILFLIVLYYFTATILSARRIYFYEDFLIVKNIFTQKQILLQYKDIKELKSSRELYRDVDMDGFGGKSFATNYELKITTNSGDTILITEGKYSNVQEIISFMKPYIQ